MLPATKKLKLCLVVPSHWAGNYGGSEQQARLLVDALISQERFELIYVARTTSEKYIPQGYAIEVVKSSLLSAKFGLFLDARALLAVLNKIKPDVIYQRVGCSYTGISAFYARKNNCRMVWHIASDVNVLPFHLDKNKSFNIVSRYIEKKILEYGIRNSDRILAQTNKQAEMLRTYYGRNVERIIPNYQPASAAPRKRQDLIKVVWVSNLKPLKRPELFIKLAEELQSHSGVEFIMVGRSGNSIWHKDLMDKIRRTVHLKYLGEIPQDEVNSLLAESHIFVNTSTYEGFPNTFIQAWMQEVPVISLEINPDNLLERYNIGFCSGSYEKLREQLAGLLLDENLRILMGKKAREYAIKNHSLNNITDLIKEISF